MKKRLKVIVLTIMPLLLLTGCFNKIPEMSEEEEKLVVRYMADAVLSKDINYQSKLLNEKQKIEALEEEARKAEELKKIEEREEKERMEKEAENSPDETPTSVAAKSYGVDEIDDYLGLENVEFEYVGEETVDKYPKSSENLGFAFTASEGNKLMILSFNLCNNTEESAYVDLATINPKFRIVINGNVKATASKVPLEDVLNFYQGTIDTGDVFRGVLIYEIPEDTSIDNIDLNLAAFGKDPIKINLK